MKLPILCFLILFIAPVPQCLALDELDRVNVYLNGKLIGTWRDGDAQLIQIGLLEKTDTLSFLAQTDLGGLANCTIDTKDDREAPIETILPQKRAELEALFTYILDLTKVKGLVSKTTTSLQVVLNMEPERNTPPKAFASISLIKK